MAKLITWTDKAHYDKYSILQYWDNRNKSKIFSTKLNDLIDEKIDLLAEYSIIGKNTIIENYKRVQVRDYYIYYIETDISITVVGILDTRSHPNKLNNPLDD
jgi:plasmid stabilization system protein ParE